MTNAWWSVPAPQYDYEKSRARHDKEEKLIIAAWYNMVSVSRRVAKPNENENFLVFTYENFISFHFE